MPESDPAASGGVCSTASRAYGAQGGYCSGAAEAALVRRERLVVCGGTLTGLLLGLVFVVGFTVLDQIWRSAPICCRDLWAHLGEGPIHWVLVSAPITLGLAGLLVALGHVRRRRRDRVMKRERIGCLAEERRRAEEYFELAGTMIVALDREGRVTRINRKGCDILGYPQEEILGVDWFERFLPKDVREMLRGVFEQIMSGHLEQSEYVENTVLDSSGRERLIAWQNHLLRDGEGRILGTLSSGEDITYQRASERALRCSEQKLAGIIASMQEGIVFADERGIIQTVNPYFCSFMGVEPEQVVGHRIQEIHSPEVGARIQEIIDDSRDGKERVFSVERELAGRHVTMRIQPVRSGDDLLGIVMSLHDITEQREARLAAEQASKAKSTFLATISHEIRTPMNGVLGTLALLHESSLGPAQEELVSTAQESAEALLRVIEDVLDFSRMEAGKLSLHPGDFRLDLLMERVRGTLASQAAARGVQLLFCIDPRLPAALRGDSVRLRQILLNLGSNAIKFTDRGGVSISAELAHDDQREVTVKFAVDDTGVGLAVEEQLKVFEDFYQVDSSDTRRHGGTGLGLAISKQLVDLMGGRIGLESTAGEGSCFWFVVRLGRGSAEQAEVEQRRTASGTVIPVVKEARPRERILLVDDNGLSRRVGVALLERIGYRVESVGSGAEALSRCAEPRYDLVLMDVQMPHMDGMETTRAMREADLRGRGGGRLPVVALTAHALAEDRERCLAAGMDDYLSKPIRVEDLTRILDRLFAGDDGSSSPPEQAGRGDEAPGRLSPGRPKALPTLVHAELLEMLGGEEDLLPGLLEMLRSDSASMLDGLSRAIHRGATREVADLAHTLKGVLGSVAGHASSDTARRIELHGEEGAMEEAARELTVLRAQVTRLIEAIEERL